MCDDCEETSHSVQQWPLIFRGVNTTPTLTLKDNPSMRRSVSLLVYRASHLQGTGVYDEDFTNDYKTDNPLHAKTRKELFGDIERIPVKRRIRTAVETESRNHNAGLRYDGVDAFERELERKGIPVEKYPLPTTVAATRAREMTLLRRLQLERMAQEAMQQATAACRRTTPSQWYDEEKGPLNPHYLQFVRTQYSGVDITDLPNQPITSKQ